ncbi:MAG: O-methyltransferase [Chitinophagaceae bacterium]
MELINDLAQQYADKFTSPEDDLLKKIYGKTVANHPQAQMISGHVQGKLLSFFSEIIKPKYILEIGTFTGYSAICLSKGLQNKGELHTLELNKKDAETALSNIKQAEKNNQIHLHVGNAQQIIPQLNYKWDLVFIDADKTGYITYYEMALPRLSENGFIIADNVLFHGEVLEQEITTKNARAIDAFNKHVAADERTEQILLTIRDGLMLIKKKTS